MASSCASSSVMVTFLVAIPNAIPCQVAGGEARRAGQNHRPLFAERPMLES
jgi:hypothetical protein